MTNTKHNMKLALLMWSMGALFYFYEFLLNVSPGVMVHELMRDFDVSAKIISVMSSIYLWIYGLMQIPVGLLLDRFGPKRLLVSAALVCALGAFIFSIANGIFLTYVGRALLGFGGAFAIVGSMKIIANWFPPQRFAFLFGCVLFIGMMGAVFGEAPLSKLVGVFGWRHALQILGVAGILITVLLYLVLHDAPHGSNTAEHQASLASESPLASICTVMFNSKQTWLASIYGALMFAPTLAFGGLWGPPFVEQAYGVSATTASYYLSYIFIGWAFGSPLVGWVSDKIQRRKTTMYIGSFGALVTMSLIIYMPGLSITMLETLMFLLGLFSSGFVMAFPLVKEINPDKYAATALGFINTLNTFGGALLQPVIGTVLDQLWAGEKLNGVPFYSTHDYQLALTCLPVVLVVSLLFLPFIKETYCRPLHTNEYA